MVVHPHSSERGVHGYRVDRRRPGAQVPYARGALVGEGHRFRPLGRTDPVDVQDGNTPPKCPNDHALPSEKDLYAWRDAHGFKPEEQGVGPRRTSVCVACIADSAWTMRDNEKERESVRLTPALSVSAFALTRYQNW